MTDPVGVTQSPSDYGFEDADRSKFIRCVDGRDFGFWVKTSLLLKFTPQRKLMSTLELSANLQPITLLEMSLIPQSSSKNPSIEVLIFSEFLIHWVLKVPIGLIISWFLFWIEELVVLWQIWIGEVNLAADTTLFPSHGVVTSLPVLLTSLGVQKICAPLRTVSVTISFDKTV